MFLLFARLLIPPFGLATNTLNIFGCSDGMEREACVCDHGFERSDLCAEIIIIMRNKNVLIFSPLAGDAQKV